jgi:hypothetical protein
MRLKGKVMKVNSAVAQGKVIEFSILWKKSTACHTKNNDRPLTVAEAMREKEQEVGETCPQCLLEQYLFDPKYMQRCNQNAGNFQCSIDYFIYK